LKAARDAGLNESEVKAFLDSGEDRTTVKNKIRMANGEIDGVPHIIICGNTLSVNLTCREET
jgi:predicted DsbA family dithiol-disulfide isomerase